MIHVLIVDADAVLRRALSSALAGGGFGVTTAGDAARARRLLEVAPADIVLLDRRLPDALDLVRAIKRKHGATIYIAILADDERPGTRAECRDAGADVVLAKPVAVSVLRRRLTSAAGTLASRRAAS